MLINLNHLDETTTTGASEIAAGLPFSRVTFTVGIASKHMGTSIRGVSNLMLESFRLQDE